MAERHRYQVSLFNRDGERPRAFGLFFECGLATVEALARELADFGVVSGQRIIVGPGENGERTVLRREDYAFGVAALVSVHPYRQNLREAA
jgi:hypothetical protein